MLENMHSRAYVLKVGCGRYKWMHPNLKILNQSGVRLRQKLLNFLADSFTRRHIAMGMAALLLHFLIMRARCAVQYVDLNY